MVDRHDKVLVATMRITTNTTPRNRYISGMLSEYWLNHLVVVIAAGKRPVSIPNLEAKPASADGTAPGRVWESRTPPQQSSQYSGSPETCKTVSGLPLSLHASKQPLEARPRTNRPLSQQPFYFSDKVGA